MDKSDESRREKAEYWRNYRKKRKLNHDQYQIHRTHETNRIKEYREKRQSEKSKQRNRELQRERQKTYRKKKKAEGIITKKPKTCENRDEQRKKWRERKRCQRNRKRKAHEMKQNSASSERSNQGFRARNQNGTGEKCPDIDIIPGKRLETVIKDSEINVPIKKAKTADVQKVQNVQNRPSVKRDAPKLSHSTQMDATQIVCLTRPFNKSYKRKNVKSSDNKSNCVDPNKTNTDIGKFPNAKHSDAIAHSDAFIYQDQKEQRKGLRPEELKQIFTPALEKLCRELKYLDDMNISIAKKPEDVKSIRKKLESCHYTDPWQFCDDIWLMFHNLLSFCKSDQQTYCSKLAKEFGIELDGVMQSIGYCCGHKYAFTPQVLCCAGKQLCTIPRGAYYYRYKKCHMTKQSNLYSHGHIYYEKCFQYCEKCFKGIRGDEIELTDYPTQPARKIPKNKFSTLKNDYIFPEHFVECDVCRRKIHQMCVPHFEAFWPKGFICDKCHMVKGTKRKENEYTAEGITLTKLGTYLEEKVKLFLKDKDCVKGKVTIRVLSSRDKVLEVKPGMKVRFCDNGKMADTFKYRAKAIFAFQEIDGTDVCFFGMHVQEYGSDCPLPNSRRVYISYLDSVHFFQPRQLRTAVYHEILIGYLEYVKQQGYLWAHIWACPPSEEDDYIFFCHPTDQKIPKSDRLQEWYKKMLDKAATIVCGLDYQDILQYANENNLNCATQIPYFDGDFWSSVLEDIIKELKQEEAKGVRKKEKNVKKSVCNEKNLNKVKVPCDDNELTKRMYATMEKNKKAFFVIKLNSDATQSLPPIKDPDPVIICDLMDGRDAFLAIATEKHHEFSSLRRAKYSTMAMLYEIHNQMGHNIVFTCNSCKAKEGTLWHCFECENFNLCVDCYQTVKHRHKMEKYGIDLEDGTSKTDKEDDSQESRRKLIEKLNQKLKHACQCKDANCRFPSCPKMRHDVSHSKSCKEKAVCRTCKYVIALCLYHAKHCTENKCKVLDCEQYKKKLKEQQLHHRLQQAQMLQRRKAVMQQINSSNGIKT